METRTIEKALALTGKTMDDVNKYRPVIGAGYGDYDIVFSIEKFCYYLLSPEFIEKYIENLKGEVYPRGFEDSPRLLREDIARGIYEYQKGNEEPIISLLEKICG